MIAVLNLAVDDVESQLATDPSTPVDVADIAARTGTTEHHLRRMFASLAGMPLSEYVRRRRMSLAAADLVERLVTTCSRSPSGTATARPKRSGAHFARCTAPAPATYGVTEVPYAHNHGSGST